MEKTGEKKKQKKPNKNEQYERFRETARKVGVDDEKSAETFEKAFKKIVPPRRRSI
jgi:hypothetical protein